MTERTDYYVYAICDPRIPFASSSLDCQPIYIGKGSGDRYQTHLKEARGIRKAKPGHNLLKVDALKAILDAGEEPRVVFLQTGLGRDAAYDLEKQFIIQFGRLGLDPGGILTNRIIDRRSLGGGKKGSKHTKPRSEEHRRKISEFKTGWVPTDETRQLWSEQRTGRKLSPEHAAKKAAMSQGGKNPMACSWIVSTPDGQTFTVRGLRTWCRENGFDFGTVYHSRKGFSARKENRTEVTE